MKKLTVEYQGYKLDIEIPGPVTPIHSPVIKGTCELLSFSRNANYGDYQDIITEFMKKADKEIEQHQIIAERFAWSAAFLSDDDEDDEDYEYTDDQVFKASNTRSKLPHY